eukprot:CAMPEP_0181231594 /NCGR_PEP_ID=MMETSP1096-20121128/35206_1 /TAXON_ID=156174 ORGANISM="Chrysochromulina ericina, Strain CCMP281" /NCGR_SAMPLE_ID=MMETSP1096 /ASSEMBLY_ACC=CAM_ASM_000453 /LENGTH=35 /DNA_ID= /DNA_START= /DNA_END= /DNA_ORIENTATION=
MRRTLRANSWEPARIERIRLLSYRSLERRQLLASP